MDLSATSTLRSVSRIKYDGCQLQKMMVCVEKWCFPLQCPADGCCLLLLGATSVWLELKNPVIKHTTDGTFSILHSAVNKKPKTYTADLIGAGVCSELCALTENGDQRNETPLLHRYNCGSFTWPLIMKNAVRCSSPSSLQPWAYVRGVAHIGFGLMEADCSDRWRLEDSALEGQIIVDFGRHGGRRWLTQQPAHTTQRESLVQWA